MDRFAEAHLRACAEAVRHALTVDDSEETPKKQRKMIRPRGEHQTIVGDYVEINMSEVAAADVGDGSS
eukprot:9358316-Prorocentrum_lima.AAC.1